PETPRPPREAFEVSSDILPFFDVQGLVAFQRLTTRAAHDDMVKKIYQNSRDDTPTLPPGQPLKLVNPELFSSIEPGFLILFTPVLVGFWHFLRAREIEPSTSAKIALGMVLTAAAAAIMYLAT